MKYAIIMILTAFTPLVAMNSLQRLGNQQTKTLQLKPKLPCRRFSPSTLQKERPFMLELDPATQQFSYSIRPAIYDCKENVFGQLLNRIIGLHEKYNFARPKYYSWWRGYAKPNDYYFNERSYLSELKLYLAAGSKDDTVLPFPYKYTYSIKSYFDNHPDEACHKLNIFFNYIESQYAALTYQKWSERITQEEAETINFFIKNHQFGNVFIWAMIPLVHQLPDRRASQLLLEIITSPFFNELSSFEQNIIVSCIIKRRSSLIFDDINRYIKSAELREYAACVYLNFIEKQKASLNDLNKYRE